MFRYRAWVVCATVVAGPAALAAPPDPAQPPPTTAAPILPGAPGENRVYLIRGEMQRMGIFDPDGNFLPFSGMRPMRTGIVIGGPYGAMMVNENSDNRSVYEHRSGRLIKGTLVANPRGVFVPEIGSTVLDLKKDYDARKDRRRVYNLPGMMGASPEAPDPPKSGQPPGWRLVPFREALANSPEKADPWFARVVGEVMELGHLSDRGEFVPDYGLPVFPFVRVKQPEVLQDGSGRSMYYTLPQPLARRWPRRQGDTEEDPEHVYEYRSGRLIKGLLHKTGNFVPELDSTVLDFKDYDPLRNSRIYNLPGVLRRVE